MPDPTLVDLAKDIAEIKETLTHFKWLIGVCGGGLVTALTILWARNKQLTDNNAKALKEHAAELKEGWDQTRDAFVKGAVVTERLAAKVRRGAPEDDEG